MVLMKMHSDSLGLYNKYILGCDYRPAANTGVNINRYLQATVRMLLISLFYSDVAQVTGYKIVTCINPSKGGGLVHKWGSYAQKQCVKQPPPWERYYRHASPYFHIPFYKQSWMNAICNYAQELWLTVGQTFAMGLVTRGSRVLLTLSVSQWQLQLMPVPCESKALCPVPVNRLSLGDCTIH